MVLPFLKRRFVRFCLFAVVLLRLSRNFPKGNAYSVGQCDSRLWPWAAGMSEWLKTQPWSSDVRQKIGEHFNVG